MSGFGDILKNGKKRFRVKNRLGDWGKCEACDARQYLTPYFDEHKQKWMICESCSDLFVKEEG